MLSVSIYHKIIDCFRSIFVFTFYVRYRTSSISEVMSEECEE